MPQSIAPQILLVDDEEDILPEYQEFLDLQGFPAGICSDPELAFTMVVNQPEIALVITDLRMAVLDGASLIRRLSASLPPERRLEFIILTGDATSQLAQDIAHVGARAYANVGINPASLEDVQWQPALEGYRILPHPGKPVRLDLPVILTSEIDGTVRLEERGLQRGIGNAQVELIDDTGVTIATTRTASDGFYTMSGIRPGRYILRIAPDQLTRLGLSVDRDASIAAKPDGGFINGIDFVVRRIN